MRESSSKGAKLAVVNSMCTRVCACSESIQLGGVFIRSTWGVCQSALLEDRQSARGGQQMIVQNEFRTMRVTVFGAEGFLDSITPVPLIVLLFPLSLSRFCEFLLLNRHSKLVVSRGVGQLL